MSDGSWGVPGTHVMPLSVGIGTGRKAVLGVGVGCVGLLLVPLTLGAIILILAAVAEIGALALLVVVPFLILTGLFLALGWFALRAGRYSAHLEGTELVIRKAFATTRCDLASARDVTLSTTLWAAYGAQQMPQLTASNDAQGRSAYSTCAGSGGWPSISCRRPSCSPWPM